VQSIVRALEAKLGTEASCREAEKFDKGARRIVKADEGRLSRVRARV
jgi:hypothetical protein